MVRQSVAVPDARGVEQERVEDVLIHVGAVVIWRVGGGKKKSVGLKSCVQLLRKRLLICNYESCSVCDHLFPPRERNTAA